MTSIGFDTSELLALGAEIGAAAVAATPAAEVGVTATADETLALAQSLAPVLTGELVASGHVERTGALTAEVVFDSDHAGFVEYGTSVMAPEPYAGPAADAAEETLVERLLKATGGLL